MKIKSPAPRSAPSRRQPAGPRRPPFFQKQAETSASTSTEELQEKTTVSRRNDPYEEEADRMADVVVSRTSTMTSRTRPALFQDISPLIRQPARQDKADGPEDKQLQTQADQEQPESAQLQQEDIQQKQEEMQLQEQDTQPQQEDTQAQQEETQARKEEMQLQAEDVQRQEDEDAQLQEEEVQLQEPEDEALQARGGTAAVTVSIDTELRAARGQGSPLPEGVRTRMESQFGADFSGVRIHTDALAVQLSQLLRAKAFTNGNDIYFNNGQFSPETHQGEHLLAHELTHTIQQGAAKSQHVQLQPSPPVLQRQEDDQATILVRPELLEAIRLARGEIGKVNAKQTNAEGERLGWERLYEYFLTAFGDKEVVHQQVIKFIHKIKDAEGNTQDAMPSWCGIFVWWAYKRAGLPIPDWKLGASILNWVKPRSPGELPRKGDIAYRRKFDHFALVTGVESPTTAAGKSFKSIEVATVNGNTSGDDNLGGQIEEKREPISRWHAFFDPVAKLDLPPAALVETSVEAEAEPAAEEPPAAAEAAEVEPVAEEPAAEMEALKDDVATEPELPASDEADVAVELPEPPAVETEEVAEVEELQLEGTSDQAMVGFLEAPPSQMAKTQPALGTQLDDKVEQEQQETVENAPVLVAETSGTVEEGLTPPEAIPVPADATIGEGTTEGDPEDLTAEPHENAGQPPSNDANEQLLEKQDEGGFLSWFRDNFKNFLSRIRTTDPGVNTSAGPRPEVRLEGTADPRRMATQRSEATDQLRAQRDTTTETLKNHPGQQNIQPKEVHEEKPVELNSEPYVEIETPPDTGATDYAEAALPEDVRNKADEMLKPNLEANLAEAKSQTQQAAQQKQTDQQTEIDKAEKETAAINKTADKDQRDIVVKNRTEVARQQKEGIVEAYGKVNEFNEEADKEQAAAQKEVSTKVTESKGQAKEKLDQAEKDAEKKKEEGEKQAREKKEELEKKEEEESWWDKAVGFVKKAVKAITDAIDTIFTAIRDAVKTIIDKAKKAVIDLINDARDWIVDKLNKFRDWAKGMVDKYLKDAFPGLAKMINDGIDAVVDTAIDGVNFVADTAIAAVEAVASALTAALDKILEVFQTALKAAVQIAGAVLTGDFAEALRIAIRAACDIAGIDAQPIFDFIDRAAGQIVSILKSPGKFFNNVMEAVGGGVRNFAKNIKKHLIGGLIGWLTGALSEVAITLPETFDVKGIFSLVMQILGLTYENIKAKVIKRFPPAATVFNVIEKSFEIVRRLVAEGPMALWEEAKQSLANLKDIVLSGIRSFVITTVIKEAITWLLGLLNPAGALVKLLKLIFDFVMFLIERFQQIKDFVMSVYNAVSEIASGAVGKATAAVEDALARSLPVVISLLASLAGLGGIGKTVKKIIAKVSKPVHKVVDRIVDRIIKFAKKLLKKGKAAVAGLVKGFVKWAGFKRTFQTDDKQTHTLFFKGEGASAHVLYVKSAQQEVETALANAKPATKPEKAALKSAKANYAKVATHAKTLAADDQKYRALEKANKANTKAGKKLKTAMVKTTKAMQKYYAKLPKDLQTLGLAGEMAGTVESDLQLGGTTKIAKPLTALPGNTTGNANASKVQPTGWKNLHLLDQENIARAKTVAVATGKKFNKKKVRKETDQFVRMHLIHHRLHGPATSDNIFGAPKGTNSETWRHIEEPVIRQVYQPGTIMQYEVTVSPHSGTYAGFAASISYQWKTMKFDKAKKQAIATKAAKKKKAFTNLQAPRSLGMTGPIQIVVKGTNIGEPNLIKLGVPPLAARRIAAALKSSPNKHALNAMKDFYKPHNEVPAGRPLSTALRLSDAADLKAVQNNQAKKNIILKI